MKIERERLALAAFLLPLLLRSLQTLRFSVAPLAMVAMGHGERPLWGRARTVCIVISRIWIVKQVTHVSHSQFFS